MTSRIDLPGNHWAEIKDVLDITERDLAPLKTSFLEMSNEHEKATAPDSYVAVTGMLHPMAGGGPIGLPQSAPPPQRSAREQIEEIEMVQHTCMAFLVTAWSLDLPVKADSFYDIPVVVKNAIEKVTSPLIEELFPGIKEAAGDRPNTTP